MSVAVAVAWCPHPHNVFFFFFFCSCLALRLPAPCCMPRDESWLNVNQIVRLVTLPRLPNVVLVRVGPTFFISHLPRGTASLTSAAHILRCWGGLPASFFHFLVRRKSLCALLSAFLRAPSVSCGWGGYRLVACLAQFHSAERSTHGVGDGSSSAGPLPSSARG